MSIQIRVQVLTRGFGTSVPTFVVFMQIELAVAILDYDVLVCAESKVSDRLHLSELCIPGFGCPQQRLRNSSPGENGMALYVREGFCSFQQNKFECSFHKSCVFRSCSRINNFYFMPFIVTQGTMGHFMIVSLARVQSFDDK